MFSSLQFFIPASLSKKARMEGSVSSCEAERQKFVQRSGRRKFWPSVDTISLAGVREKSRALHGFIFGNVFMREFQRAALIIQEKVHVAIIIFSHIKKVEVISTLSPSHLKIFLTVFVLHVERYFLFYLVDVYAPVAGDIASHLLLLALLQSV